jgi:predicted secreted protein
MKIRHVKKGDVFTIDFIENPSTGFLWKMEAGKDIELRGVSTITDNSGPPEEMIGSPITKVFFLQINEPGEYNLLFAKKRPWEKSAPPIETYQEIIKVLE